MPTLETVQVKLPNGETHTFNNYRYSKDEDSIEIERSEMPVEEHTNSVDICTETHEHRGATYDD